MGPHYCKYICLYNVLFLMKNSVFVFVFVFVMASCSRVDDGMVRGGRAIDSIMDQAENTMDDDAAFADSLMRLIDPYSIKGANRKARYALLYTAAEYKNYQLLTSDSLIMEAVRYYSIRNNMDYRFLSYYYLGCAYIDMGQMMDASVALVQAEQMVDKIDNDYWKGLMYHRMGDIFTEYCNYIDAESYYTKAEFCFNRADKQLHRLYSLYEIGQSKYNKLEYKDADSIFQIVDTYALVLKDSTLCNNCFYNRLYCALNMNEIDSAIALYNSFESQNKKVEHFTGFLELMALYYNAIKDFEKSESYLESAWKRSLSKTDSIYLYYISAQLSKEKGDFEKSLEFYDKYTGIQNKELRDLLNKPIIGKQRDYYHAISELEAVRARNRVTILVFSALSFVLIVSFILLVNLNHRRKVQQEIRDYLSTIDDLTARESVNKSRISLLNGQVRDMLRQQFTHSDYLYTRYYEQIDDNKKAERLFRVVKTQIDQFTAPKSISRIDELLNKTFDGIMDKLSSSGLELKEKELMLLRFVLAGFSAKSIAAILDDTNVNITQRKKRLLDKIQNKAPNIMDELRNALNIK